MSSTKRSVDVVKPLLHVDVVTIVVVSVFMYPFFLLTIYMRW